MDWIDAIVKKLEQLDKFDVVHVKWADIISDCSWVSTKDIEESEPAECHSVGYLISTNKYCIKISSSYDFDQNCGSIEVIPIGCIIDINLLMEA